MNKRFKDAVVKTCRKMRNDLFHGEYKMSYEFQDEPKPSKLGNPDKTIGAQISVDTVYLDAKIEVFPVLYDYYEDGDYYYIVETLCHEICHLLTEPMYTFAFKLTREGFEEKVAAEIRERQTQRICNIVMSMIDYKKDYEPLFSKPKKK